MDNRNSVSDFEAVSPKTVSPSEVNPQNQLSLPKLTQQQLDFCEAILLGKTNRDAAEMAGLAGPPSSLSNTANNWLKLPDVIGYLTERRKEIYAATELTKERIASEISNIAYLDIIGIYDEFGDPLPPDQLPENIRRAVKSVEIEVIYEGSGKYKRAVGKRFKYTFYDKLAAMAQAAKMYGHNAPDRLNVAGVIATLPEDMSVEELRALAGGTGQAPKKRGRRKKSTENEEIPIQESKKVDWDKIEEAEIIEDEDIDPAQA
jgi:phage terminase small subunit